MKFSLSRILLISTACLMLGHTSTVFALDVVKIVNPPKGIDKNSGLFGFGKKMVEIPEAVGTYRALNISKKSKEGLINYRVWFSSAATKRDHLVYADSMQSVEEVQDGDRGSFQNLSLQESDVKKLREVQCTQSGVCAGSYYVLLMPTSQLHFPEDYQRFKAQYGEAEQIKDVESLPNQESYEWTQKNGGLNIERVEKIVVDDETGKTLLLFESRRLIFAGHPMVKAELSQDARMFTIRKDLGVQR